MSFLQGEKLTVCAVCGSTKDVVVSLPGNPDTLKKWANILNTPSLESARRKKICLLHFEKKWHRILKDPNIPRTRYCFPIPPEQDPLELVSVELGESAAQSSVSTEVTMRDSRVPHNRCNQEPNYPLMISIRNEEIKKLKETVKTLRVENQKLKKFKQAIPTTQEILAKTELSVPAKTMVSLLLSPGHVYSNEAKDLARILYNRNPINYKHLRLLLDRKLPSTKRILEWNAADRLKKTQKTEVKMESKTKDAS